MPDSPNTEIFRGSEVVSDTFPFRGEFARVEVSLNDLRRDFIDAAVEQGVDEGWAWRFSLFIDFTFQNYGEFLKQCRAKNISLPAKAKRKLDDMLRLPSLGAVLSDEREEIGCFLDIGEIVKHVSEGKAYPGFKIPKKISEEARRAAVSQALNRVWRHERQHLIRACQPDVFKKDLKKAAHYARARAIAFTGYAIGGGLMLVSLRVPEKLRLDIITAGISSALASATIFTGFMQHEAVQSPDEKEASKKEKMVTGAGPFKVSFES